MKKILLAGSLVLSCATATMAQTLIASLDSKKKELKNEMREISKEENDMRKNERAIKRSEVSSMTKDQFAKDFPNAYNPEFYVGKYFEEVSFSKDGKWVTAYYDYNSMLVGTTTPAQFSDLPLIGQREIRKHYKEYSVDEIILFDDNETNETDMWMYGQQFADADNYFVELSKDGKRIVVQVSVAGGLFFFKKLNPKD